MNEETIENLRKCSELDIMKRMNLNQHDSELLSKALFGAVRAVKDSIDLEKENTLLKEKLGNIETHLLAYKKSIIDDRRDNLEFLDDLIKISKF
jgi:hypothetical protein